MPPIGDRQYTHRRRRVARGVAKNTAARRRTPPSNSRSVVRVGQLGQDEPEDEPQVFVPANSAIFLFKTWGGSSLWAA
eukprot:COSAG02_NODE_7848_length_2820_cov_3.458287_3_plen_78_part_00